MPRKLVVVGTVVIAPLALAAFWFLTIPETVPAGALGPHTPDLANGKTMFYAGGCASCHAVPKQEDKTRLGGGLALGSPFGTFYVPNISSDRTDGIGAWSEAQFRHGHGQRDITDGRAPFSGVSLHVISADELDDIRDLFAYLKTLPAVAGKVRDHALPFPFNIRRTLGLWKLLFLDGRPFTPDPSQVGAVEPRCVSGQRSGPLRGVSLSPQYSGGNQAQPTVHRRASPDGQGGVPNITQQKLKDWTVKDIADTLTTGMTPDADFVGGSMVEVVRNTSQLSAADREAMATYVKSLPAAGGSAPGK